MLTQIWNLWNIISFIDNSGICFRAQAAMSAGGQEARSSLQMDRAKTQPKPSKNRDMDGRTSQQYLVGLGDMASLLLLTV